MPQIERKLYFFLAFYPRLTAAWVDHYDQGEDDAKVVRVFLPLIACAILACIGGCYFKKHCAKEDEDKEKDTEGKDHEDDKQSIHVIEDFNAKLKARRESRMSKGKSFESADGIREGDFANSHNPVINTDSTFINARHSIKSNNIDHLGTQVSHHLENEKVNINNIHRSKTLSQHSHTLAAGFDLDTTTPSHNPPVPDHVKQFVEHQSQMASNQPPIRPRSERSRLKQQISAHSNISHHSQLHNTSNPHNVNASHVSRHNSHAGVGYASRGNSRHSNLRSGGTGNNHATSTGHPHLTERDLSLVPHNRLSDQELLNKDLNEMTEEEFIRYQQLQSQTLTKRPASMRSSLPIRPAMTKDSFHDDEHHRYS